MRKFIKRLKNHFRRTWMNKLCAMVLVACGLVINKIDGDGTMLVIALILGSGLFFSKENWMI